MCILALGCVRADVAQGLGMCERLRAYVPKRPGTLGRPHCFCKLHREAPTHWEVGEPSQAATITHCAMLSVGALI